MKVNITIPALDEEAKLSSSVRQLLEFLTAHCRFDSEVVIADNGSTDKTWEIAGALCLEHPGVRRVQFSQKGHGRAVKKVWSESDCDILTYMDVDLATESPPSRHWLRRSSPADSTWPLALGCSSLGSRLAASDVNSFPASTTA